MRKRYTRWLAANTSSLVGKTVAVTGSTGGLGTALCRYLAMLGASLVLVDRNPVHSQAFRDELIRDYGVSVRCVGADLEDMASVKAAAAVLKAAPLDVLIHNAGAYDIPRKVCTTGYDNVFQINFVSPYYMIRELLPSLASQNGKVVVVGSIAHNYSKTDPAQVDFADRKQASKVYGNAKRYLMYAMYSLIDKSPVSFSVTHPGISFTGITDHYPKWLFTLIKHPMKWIFMKPPKACLSILKGVFDSCQPREWIGPRVADVWGLPRKTVLHTASEEEMAFIGKTAESVYRAVSVDTCHSDT